jgi:nicotinamidase-related amidase
VLIGATTSGCVRATAIDSHSHGYPTFVVEEAVFDRSHLSHGVNLFEMNAKYAEVLALRQLEAQLPVIDASANAPAHRPVAEGART